MTDPAGVQGAHQEAGAAEDGVVAAEAAGEERLEDAVCATLAAEATLSAGFSGATVASSAATAEARSGVNLLALKLEAIMTLFGSRERMHVQRMKYSM